MLPKGSPSRTTIIFSKSYANVYPPFFLQLASSSELSVSRDVSRFSDTHVPDVLQEETPLQSAEQWARAARFSLSRCQGKYLQLDLWVLNDILIYRYMINIKYLLISMYTSIARERSLVYRKFLPWRFFLKNRASRSIRLRLTRKL